MASLEETVKRTQDMFKELIRKPPLTDKLLSRPPFRYLHDVLMELGRKHKFLKGLYSGAELDSEQLKEKEAKLAFLQKSIDAVSIIQGAPVLCKAAKMISGQDADKTNEFLQQMAQCIITKKDSSDAVKQVLAGKGAKSKEPSKAKESSSRDKKSKSTKEPTGTAEAAAAAAPSTVAEAAAAVAAGEDAGAAREGRRTKRPKEDESKASKSRDKDKERRREGKSKDAGESHGKKEEGKQDDSQQDSRPSRDEDKERRRRERKERERAKEGKKKEEEVDEKTAAAAAAVAAEGASADGGERPPSPKSSRRGRQEADKPSPPTGKKSGDATGIQEPDFLRPPLPPGQRSSGSGKQQQQQQQQRGPGRPSSARPAPPKVRSRQDSAGSEDALSRVSSNVTVQQPPLVVDNNDDDDDNEDMFVVDSAVAPSVEEQPTGPTLDVSDDPSEHGMLVRKILDTRKEQEQSLAKSAPAQESAASIAQRRKRKEKTEKEVASLRESVQALCRSANPLAKTVDSIQEDVESMLRELDHWQEQGQVNSADLIKEKELTESELEPLRQNLTDLEASVLEKMDLISVLKANIAKNDQQINQLVSGIALSSRQ